MSNDDPDSKTNPDQGRLQPRVNAVEDIAHAPESAYSSTEYRSINHG
jgi:hypothetical protein